MYRTVEILKKYSHLCFFFPTGWSQMTYSVWVASLLWIWGFSSCHYSDVKAVICFCFFSPKTKIMRVWVPLHWAYIVIFSVRVLHTIEKHYANKQLNSYWLKWLFCFQALKHSPQFSAWTSSMWSVQAKEFWKWMLCTYSRVFPKLSGFEALSGKICYCRSNSQIEGGSYWDK